VKNTHTPHSSYFLSGIVLPGRKKDSINHYVLPDSVKAVYFISSVKLSSLKEIKVTAGTYVPVKCPCSLEAGKKASQWFFGLRRQQDQ
jgi:hypothetical protein